MTLEPFPETLNGWLGFVFIFNFYQLHGCYMGFTGKRVCRACRVTILEVISDYIFFSLVLSVKQPMYFWDKAHLVILHYLFYILLDSNC